jgi:uncharacterized RDD family membrane protein YckC
MTSPMTCPSCGGELDPAMDRCPVCDASGVPRVEGALAADPRYVTPPARSKAAEPLRDIPGLRKKEKSWRDEVQERVRSRRNKRALAGLPLFEQAEAQEIPAAPQAQAPAQAAPPQAAEPQSSRVEAATADAVTRPVTAGEGPRVETEATLGRPDDLVTMRLSEAELGDLPLNADEAELASRAREEAVLPRATRRPMPSLDEEALVPEALAEPEVELPPLATEAPPLERPAYPVERAQAAAVDAILFGALAVIVLYFTGRAARVDVTALVPSWPGLALYLGMLGLFYAGYFTGTTGQTPGKLMTGLRVLGASGRPPSYPRAMARALLGLVGIVLAGASLVPMAFDPARRTLHDRLFRTRVVRG